MKPANPSRTKYYADFKRIRNSACVTVQTQAKTLAVTVRLNSNAVTLEDGFTGTLRKTGHWGTGDLEITLRALADLEKAKPLLDQAYDQSCRLPFNVMGDDVDHV